MGAWIEPFGKAPARSAVYRDARNIKIVGIHIVVIARVGHRAANESLDRLGRIDFGELQNDQGFSDTLAANRIRDAA